MIESNYFWIVIALLAIGTLLIRSSVILVSGRFEITDRHRELFSYIPAAIIPALIVPMVFFHQGPIGVLGGAERLVSLVLAAAVCWFSRSILLTLLIGLIMLYLLTQVF